MIFPTLNSIGDNMLSNFLLWGQKRLDEIPNDQKVLVENKSIEIGKLNDRLKKFKEKMAFLDKCKEVLSEARENKTAILSGSNPSAQK